MALLSSPPCPCDLPPSSPNSLLTKVPKPFLPFQILSYRRQLFWLTLHKPIRPRPDWYPVLATHFLLLDLGTRSKKHLRLCGIFVGVAEPHQSFKKLFGVPAADSFETATAKVCCSRKSYFGLWVSMCSYSRH